MAGVGLGLEVLEGLDQLGTGVHHERTVGGHRLADGLATKDQDVELLVAALLGAGGLDGEHVAGAVDGQLAHADRLAPGPGRARPGQHVDQGVEVGPPGQLQPRPRGQGGVLQRDRGVGDARAVVAGDLAGDHPQQGAAVRRAQQLHRAAADVLVAGRRPLEPSRQVDPEPEAVEQPATDYYLLRRRLDVQHASTGSNPVHVAFGEDIGPNGWHDPPGLVLSSTSYPYQGYLHAQHSLGCAASSPPGEWWSERPRRWAPGRGHRDEPRAAKACVTDSVGITVRADGKGPTRQDWPTHAGLGGERLTLISDHLHLAGGPVVLPAVLGY